MDVVGIVRELAQPHSSLELSAVAAGVVVLDREAIERLRGAALERSGARALREDLVRWVRGKNQFFAITPETEEEIEDALIRLVDDVGEGDLVDAQDALDDALDGLSSILRDALGDARREVVASAYAPELQLHVLGLRLSDVVSPVLDVGCGASALLVRHLRGLGHDVTGIDREAPTDATRVDWITFDYGTARWRTILSHLGFSLHFLRAHRASEAEARRHAEAFLRITRSLVVGGAFAYAPSLPFFESVLPADRFRIERRRLSGGETLESLRSKSGVDLAEATRLTRMG